MQYHLARKWSTWHATPVSLTRAHAHPPTSATTTCMGDMLLCVTSTWLTGRGSGRQVGVWFTEALSRSQEGWVDGISCLLTW